MRALNFEFKIAMIWLVSFIVVLIILNFGFLVSYFEPKASQANNKLERNSITSKPYLFPLSDDVIKAASPTPPKTKAPAQISSKYFLELTTLGVSAPIILESSLNLSQIYASLEKGVVHYASTPLPDQWGTSIILGHSSRPLNYKGSYAYIFSKLEKLNEGDIFRIYKEGQPMIYEVSRKIIFNSSTTDQQMLKEFEKSTGQAVILMTCWPTGTNSKRIAIRAELKL